MPQTQIGTKNENRACTYDISKLKNQLKNNLSTFQKFNNKAQEIFGIKFFRKQDFVTYAEKLAVMELKNGISAL
uniref:Uncharacterized protein n=1 Tax=Rhizophagus irregularis (strain DAOM 181602 / DAOM 197198 / MUCL 43194) TaxID=747089 RepID=U9TP30_RHIID